jgi:hypothetical protein
MLSLELCKVRGHFQDQGSTTFFGHGQICPGASESVFYHYNEITISPRSSSQVSTWSLDQMALVWGLLQ